MKAAVMRANHAPLEIEDIAIDKPGPNEVLLRTVASGICHSDLHVIEGNLPMPPPTVLGHEPAGVVEAVGSDVRDFAPGDHVIGCLSAFCGSCESCMKGRPYLCQNADSLQRSAEEAPRLSKDGEAIPQFANLSSFAEQMLTHERALVKISPEMPLDRAALIGCGVTTGLGAALRTARVEPGSTTVVIGCGGVGLAAIQGCRIAGASRIFAVDTESWKLELAQKLGATDVVNAADGDPTMAVLGATGGGADYAFECIGLKPTVNQAVNMVRAGGAAVCVGVAPVGQMLEFHQAMLVLQEKRILGSMMGSNRFRIDMPTYVNFYLDGRLKLDEMISRRIELDGVNEAIEAMKKGEVARSVIAFDGA